MARDGARRVSRKGAICAARGDTDEIATPGAITSLSASWALAVGRGGCDRRGGRCSQRAQRARQGDDRSLQVPAPRALRMLHALAVAARIAPGREHEGGRGRRLRGEERVPIEDDEAAIEELAKFHATAGVGAAAGPGRDLEPTGAQPHVPPIMPRSAWRPGDIGFLTSHAANRTKTAQRGMVPLIPGSPRRARCAPTLGSQWRRTLLPRWRRTCAVLPPAVVYSRPITSHSPVSSARRSPI